MQPIGEGTQPAARAHRLTVQEARFYGYSQVQFEFAFTQWIAFFIVTISIQVVVFAFASRWEPSRHGNVAQPKGS